MGIGIPVIWTCSELSKEELHFDTRQYNHIMWKDGNNLKELLISRIKATISIKNKITVDRDKRDGGFS